MAWKIPGHYYSTVSRDHAFCALFSTDIRSSLPPAHGWLRKFPRSVSCAENHDDPQKITHRKKADGDIFCCRGFQIIKTMKLFMLLNFFKCHWHVSPFAARRWRLCFSFSAISRVSASCCSCGVTSPHGWPFRSYRTPPATRAR